MSTSDPGRQVPAIVISGFLGAGKTTLMLRLLEEAREQGRRAAVISNEFGALGIDQALLSGASTAIVELEGGCVCCQLSNDLRDTVVRLREAVDPDIFLVETSGLALASETLLTFWRDPLRAWISDDIGIVVVSALQVLERRDIEGTFEHQLGAADLIVLNKVDLVPPESLPEIERTIRGIEPEAPIVRIVRGEIDPAVLVPRLSGTMARRSPPSPASDHLHDQFRSEVLTFGITSESALLERLDALEPVRAKGFVETTEGVRLLQRVGSRTEISQPAGPVDPTLIGRVVIVRRIAQFAAPAEVH